MSQNSEVAGSSQSSMHAQPSGPSLGAGMAVGSDVAAQNPGSNPGVGMAGSYEQVLSKVLEVLREEREQSEVRFKRMEDWLDKVSKQGSPPRGNATVGEAQEATNPTWYRS